MAGETPAHHHQDPQTPRPINLPGRLRSAEENPPHGSQRGYLLVAACHRQSTAAAHSPARLPKAQWLLKESCTVHQPDAGDECPCGGALDGCLPDLGETSAAAKPGEGSFN